MLRWIIHGDKVPGLLYTTIKMSTWIFPKTMYSSTNSIYTILIKKKQLHVTICKNNVTYFFIFQQNFPWILMFENIEIGIYNSNIEYMWITRVCYSKHLRKNRSIFLKQSEHSYICFTNHLFNSNFTLNKNMRR
jgi:hypothetical protein